MTGALAMLSLAAGCANGDPAAGSADASGTTASGTTASGTAASGTAASGDAAAGRAGDEAAGGGCPAERLRDRAAAFAAGDVAAWDAAGEASGAALAALGLGDLRYEPLRCEAGVQWARLGYGIAGFDEAFCELDQAWRLEQVGGLVRVGGAPAPWEWPDALVRRSVDSVVVTAVPSAVQAAPSGHADVTVPARGLQEAASRSVDPRREGAVLSALVADAAKDLRAFWGEPRVRPVVLLPPDPDAFAVLAAGASHGASAVTVGPVRDGRALGCDRVVLHPSVWADLTPEGRRVVLTHELTHVAIRRDLRGTRPAWLVEGVCEYAAYRRSTLAPAQIARPLLERFRGAALPDDLPGEADLAGPDPGWAYAAAWRACHVIVARAGEGALLEAARASGHAGVARVLTDRLGWQLPDLVAAWRQDLAALVRSAGP